MQPQQSGLQRLTVEIPADTEPAGYARLIIDHNLVVLAPSSLTFIANKWKRQTIVSGRTKIRVFPPSYDPGPVWCDQLEFALKYDGIDLQVLAAFFQTIDRLTFEDELCRRIAARPGGANLRRIWFLYEFLTGRLLTIDDGAAMHFEPLLDPAAYYTAAGVRSRRHHIINNLPGNSDFCPLVRRTARLAEFEATDLSAEAMAILAEFDADAIRRATTWLYTKETRSSFDIEGEHPSSTRADRFVNMLKTLPGLPELTDMDLLRLQNATVDPRYADTGYRTTQVYVGERLNLTSQKIHFIGARPQDVPALMNGLLKCLSTAKGSGINPVVLAAAIAFGFVFIHPFNDGNGRLHRMLIHYILSRMGFTPDGLIFPVSAVMLARRNEYDATLESFSAPLMRVIDYDEDDRGVVTVRNDTAHMYRYFDATPLAEALYGWVQETIRADFRQELTFIVTFRELRKSLTQIVDMPDMKADLLLKLCLQNHGRLSASKRRSQFPELTDAEIAEIESLVGKHLDAFEP